MHNEGITLSALRPAGIAEIEGQRVDVVTKGEMVGRGDRVRVTEVEGNRVVVERLK
jgi:membrane-bound serine protease (ClpP class)